MAAISIKDETTTDSQNDSNPSISNMALYNLSRAHSHLASLSTKPKWTNADTSSFDCMHYDSDAALEHCASKIHLKPNQHVLDIGSGFSATGRFLASRYRAWVTGIELQRENHELAQLITARNVEAGVVQRVRSVNADFLSLTPEILVGGSDGQSSSSSSSSSAHFDHIISFLCITHIPESARSALFHQAALFLKPGGTLYIEDFYDNSFQGGTESYLTAQEVENLQTVMACPYLPSSSKWIADVQSAGFDNVEFEDVSMKWRAIVRARAERYRAEERPDAELRRFYDVVAESLEGNVGGVRLTAVRG